MYQLINNRKKINLLILRKILILTKDLEHELTQVYMYYCHRDVKNINGILLKPTLFFKNINIINNSKKDNENNKKKLIEYQDELYKNNGNKI